MEPPVNAAAAFLEKALNSSSLIQAETLEAKLLHIIVNRLSDGVVEILKRAGFQFTGEPYEPDCSVLSGPQGAVSLVVTHPEAGHEDCSHRSFHLTFSTPTTPPLTFQIHAFQAGLELDIPDDEGGSWEGYSEDASGLSIYIEPLIMKIFPEIGSQMMFQRLRDPARTAEPSLSPPGAHI